MDSLIVLVNRLAKAIGLPHDNELPNLGIQTPPRVSTVSATASRLFERFLSLFSFSDKAPASPPTASMPSYQAPSPPFPCLLPHYVKTGDHARLSLYLKNYAISSIDFDSENFTKSPLTAAAEGGKVGIVNILLPYASLKHVGDSLRAMACLPANQRNCQNVIKSAKALAQHLRGHSTYIDTVHLNKERTFLPEQTAWLDEMRGARTPYPQRLPG